MPDPGIKKIFSVPCVNEVFSIVTCIYCRFDSQAPERVCLIVNPGMSWKICAGRCILYTHVICVICVISFALIKCVHTIR